MFWKGTWDLPDTDEGMARLLDRPSTIFLTPWRPKFASKGLGHQEGHLRNPGNLLADTKSFRYPIDSICIHTSIEIHWYLNEENDTESATFATWESYIQAYPKRQNLGAQSYRLQLYDLFSSPWVAPLNHNWNLVLFHSKMYTKCRIHKIAILEREVKTHENRYLGIW